MCLSISFSESCVGFSQAMAEHVSVVQKLWTTGVKP